MNTRPALLGPEHPRPLCPEAAASLDALSPDTAAALTAGGALVLPWADALRLLDAFEHDEPLEGLTGLSAPLDATARAVVLEALLLERLPPRMPAEVELRADGLAGKPGFKLHARWRAANGLPMDPQPVVRGGLVEHRRAPWRMTGPQYATLARCGGGGLPGTADFEADLERVAEAKALAGYGVRLSPFLERERLHRVEAIEPRLTPTAEGVRVEPSAPGLPDERLAGWRLVDEGRLGRGLDRVAPDGARERVVLAERAREGLRTLRRLPRTLTPRQAAEVLSDPQAFFGPALDLSRFDERVTGLGPIIRTLDAPILGTSGEQWWEWTLSAPDGAGDGDDRLDLREAAIRASLRAAIEAADAQGLRYIPHPTRPGLLLELTDRLRDRLARAEAAAAPAPERIGLIVRENVEDLQFAPKLAEPDRSDRRPPPNLRADRPLHPWQIEGYLWLNGLNAGAPDGQRRGALLADDMGLGKTLQVLAHLDRLQLDGRRGPHLVVAPVSLLENWRREAAEFFGSAFEPIHTVQGGGSALSPGVLERQRLVLTSYETLTRSERLFAPIAWDTVIADEAQKSKNPETQIARVLRTLRARFRLAMTGTPVENRLRELWTLFDWAVPGLLGSLRSFETDFEGPLAAAGTPERRRIAAALHARIEKHFLRRTKRDALGHMLPELIHEPTTQVPLSDAQETAYTGIIAEARKSRGAARLGSLIRLFGVCAHPDLGADLADLRPLAQVPYEKGARLFEVLEHVKRRGEKALVFANRNLLQAWIAAEIARRHGIRVDVVNGEVGSAAARLRMVERFSAQPGFGVLVLAPRVAGLGLNIVAANHVVHFMREWNPAVENQATDRAWRLKQTRPVHVYTITATSRGGETVEEKLARLLERKRQLMADFVVPLGGVEVTPEELLQ